MADETQNDAREAQREADYFALVSQVSKYLNAISNVDKTDLRKLGHRDSRRGKQRALALFLGHHDGGRVSVPVLRRLLTEHNIYNQANFAQDMTKDSDRYPTRALWSGHTYRYSRELSGYWHLTEKGAELARRYVEAVAGGDPVVRAREVLEQVKGSIVIREKVARCPFCREEVVDTDLAVCSSRDRRYGSTAHGCGSKVHALCLDEFVGGRDECVLSRTTAQCAGRYKVVAKPEVAEAVTEGGE